jgi:hypothetical protein
MAPSAGPNCSAVLVDDLIVALQAGEQFAFPQGQGHFDELELVEGIGQVPGEQPSKFVGAFRAEGAGSLKKIQQLQSVD